MRCVCLSACSATAHLKPHNGCTMQITSGGAACLISALFDATNTPSQSRKDPPPAPPAVFKALVSAACRCITGGGRRSQTAPLRALLLLIVETHPQR